MSEVETLIAEIERRGIRLELSPDGEKVKAFGRGEKPTELLESLKAHKPQVVEYLREKSCVALCGSPKCAGCYEVKPGVRLHPPKVSREWKNWLEKQQPVGDHKAN